MEKYKDLVLVLFLRIINNRVCLFFHVAYMMISAFRRHVTHDCGPIGSLRSWLGAGRVQKPHRVCARVLQQLNPVRGGTEALPRFLRLFSCSKWHRRRMLERKGKCFMISSV